MSKMLHITSVGQLTQLIGWQQLEHPLITLLKPINLKAMPELKEKIIIDLYSISLKTGYECKIKYGRQNYDFQQGTLICLAPGQVIEPMSPSENSDHDGWTLVFHPDLLHSTHLAEHLNDYSFFYYDSHEALHLSEQERVTITSIVKSIEDEYSQNLDDFSQELMVSNIELLLNHCKRFYSRQMITRKRVSSDVVMQFERLLKSYFDSITPLKDGLPSVKYCSEVLGYSTNYLSDLLKKETGKNTQEHIHFYLIERAKILLLGSNEPISSIAYNLGFKSPQHFSVLFKKKTGFAPNAFRN